MPLKTHLAELKAARAIKLAKMVLPHTVSVEEVEDKALTFMDFTEVEVREFVLKEIELPEDEVSPPSSHASD